MIEPPKPIKLPGKFKGETVVYLAYGKNNRLLYVGITNDFYSRMGQHSKTSDWYPYALRFEVEPYETRHQAGLREKWLVRYRAPTYNTALQSEKRRKQIREAKELMARPGCVYCDDPVMEDSRYCRFCYSEVIHGRREAI